MELPAFPIRRAAPSHGSPKVEKFDAWGLNLLILEKNHVKKVEYIDYFKGFKKRSKWPRLKPLLDSWTWLEIKTFEKTKN